MDRAIPLSFLAVFVICLLLTSTRAACARVIKLHFPDEASCGQLFELGRPVAGDDSGRMSEKFVRLGAAKGQYSLKIADGHSILLEPNQYLFRHPDQLLKFSSDGIEAVRITFVSMDDSEDKLCLGLCKNLKHLKAVKNLQFNGAEISDAEVEALGPMPSLVDLDLPRTNVTGKVAQALSPLTNLTQLTLAQNNICGIDFSHMASLKSLKIMRLTNCMIRPEDFKNIGQLTALEFLDIDGTTCGDSGLKCLLPLKNLRRLSLARTGVSLNGILQLSKLELTSLQLPREYNVRQAREILNHAFPNTQIIFDKAGKVINSDSDMKNLFAPLH